VNRPTEKQVAAYVMQIANRMTYGWTFSLSCQPEHYGGNNAQIEILLQRRNFGISLYGGFFEEDAEAQRQTIVHEILHLIQEPAQHLVRDTLWKTHLLSQSVYDLLIQRLKHENECAVEHLSRLIAPSMPLPPWAGKEEKEQKA
jgi:hypothetical protein